VNRKTGVPRVQWEKNGLVQRNPMIEPDDIFDKCPTSKFPEGASVRITSQKNGHATVYFNSPPKTRTFGSGKNAQSYTYSDATLKVSLPMISTWNKETYSFAYTGQLPSEFTLDEMNAVLKYAREQIQEMTGNTHIVIKDDRQKLFPELAN
tara:strand:+ start:205 stop:657 length:453 start_codon:yes stop_codon:yes gene_type:complete